MKKWEQHELAKIAQTIIRKIDPLYLSYSYQDKNNLRKSIQIREMNDEIDLLPMIEKYLGRCDNTEEYYYYYNSVATRVRGLGVRFLTFNEHWVDEKTLSCQNLLELDKALEDEQNSLIREAGGIVRVDEPLRHMAHWARVILSGRLYYMSLNSMYIHLSDFLAEQLGEEIQKLVPYDFVEGPAHGEPAGPNGEHSIWDFQLSAGGNEEIVEELINQLSIISESVAKKYAAQEDGCTPSIFLNVLTKTDYDPHVEVIVNNKRAASLISLDNFHHDANKLMVEPNVLNELKTKVLTEATALLMVEWERLKPLAKVSEPISNVINLFKE